MPHMLAEEWVPDEPNVMEITGRLDDHSATRLEEDVYLCIKSGARRMVLDCSNLTYISAAGLRAILKLARAMQLAGGNLVVCHLQPQVAGMFKAIGCQYMVPVFSDRNEAFTAMAA